MNKMKLFPVVLALLFLLNSTILGAASPAPAKSGKQKRKSHAALSCRLLPANNVWNTPIDTLPVDANSAAYIDTIGADRNIHADFGSGLWDGGPIGIPFTTVPGSQEKVAVSFYYDDESDPGPYPIPPDAPIEGGDHSDGDRHVLVVDRDNCILYELYDARPQGDGTWTAGSGAIYDLNSNALRPAGWTSADAAGLPILPGLVRYEEVAAGEIKHAIRFTVPQTKKAYIWPARHYASSLTGTQYPPMGQRFRLKADYDISGYSAHVQVILKALKKYGMILADNGSTWFISGEPDERWNNDVLHQLHNVKGKDFEAVDESSLMVNANSGEAHQNVETATITVVTPNGGENWTAGTTQNIAWTSTGTVGNIKIRYSTDNGRNWSTEVSSTANDGSYTWMVPGTASNECLVWVGDTDGDPVDTSDSVFTIAVTTSGQPEISLDREQLNVGAVISGASTGPQHFRIANSGTGTLNWTVTTDVSWLSVTPATGAGTGKVTVSVTPEGLTTGTYAGAITVTDPAAENSPQTVTVNLDVMTETGDQAPFGSFDSPQEGAVVMSSIPVTGWALDDVEVERVKIYRDPVSGEGTARVYIGDAVLVEGARQDVELANPTYPNNYKAGWGYMMLTNYLPNGGNGSVTLYAVARDVGGRETTLGSKNITGDNADAVKPFGAIDTPAQGGEASGASYINWGWVLTPKPNAIPEDGSTINVWVDGVDMGHPVYNNYRADIAGLFPGYANSDGAVGYFYMDTTGYDDGVHTIQWTATDDDGNTDGIGSRFFTVENAARSFSRDAHLPCMNYNTIRNAFAPVRVKKGYRDKAKPVVYYPDESGVITIRLEPLERLEIHLSPSATGVQNHPDSDKPSENRSYMAYLAYQSYQPDKKRIRALPVGSHFDSEKGILYWQPGPGYTGSYRLIIVSRDKKGATNKREIAVIIGL